MSPLITVYRPWLVMPAEPPNVPKGAAAPSGTSTGIGGTAQATVLKVQLKSFTIVLPGTARSLAPLLPPRMRAV